MNRSVALLVSASALALTLAPSEARAQKVQIAPAVGYQFGGSFLSPVLDQKYSFDSALSYGGTIDIAINKSWRVELLYSKQDSQISANTIGGGGFDLAIERLMIGIQEEKGAEAEEKVRYFGTFLMGATRFNPGPSEFEDVTKLGLGMVLGVKTFPSKNVGLRFEARGFYTAVEADGGAICGAGACLFNFSSSGFWQGDLSAGLILAF